MMLKIMPLPGEEVLLIARKISNKFTKHILLSLTAVLVSILIFLYAQIQLLSMVAVVIFIVTILFDFMVFLTWYNDITIITNKRLVIVDKTGLFSHKVTEINVQDIVAVSYQQRGILGAVTSSGEVEILDMVGHKTFLKNIVRSQAVYETIQAIVSRTRQNT